MTKTSRLLLPSRPIALPARFRRSRCLIIGCGDVGQRLAQVAGAGRRTRVLALTSNPSLERTLQLRALGVTPIRGDLDDRKTLHRLAGLSSHTVHLAPPRSVWEGVTPTPQEKRRDQRTKHLLSVLAKGRVRSLVYVSTTGVYGNCRGAWVTENRPVAPATDRAHRRVEAEQQLRRWAGRTLSRVKLMPRVSILRAPGIYAPDRKGGTPRARLERGTPILQAQDDVYTNHIHADDLARACWYALWRAPAQRIYNVVDASDLRMGDYFEQAAKAYGLPRPPRISWAQAQQSLPAITLSFLGESRRLSNQRVLRELRWTLRYPTVAQGLGWPVA